MAIEKERKFLVDKNKLPDGLPFKNFSKIKQGYIITNKDCHLRIKIINNSESFLCYKNFKENKYTLEYEYPVSIEDGLEMYALSKVKIEKTKVVDDSYPDKIEINIYNDGLITADIKYTDEIKEIPEYCVKEITGNKKYSNINILKGDLKCQKV